MSSDCMTSRVKGIGDSVVKPEKIDEDGNMGCIEGGWKPLDMAWFDTEAEPDREVSFINVPWEIAKRSRN
jgi:hypothetical protein